MTTLAFEFSTDRRTAAVVHEGRCLAEVCHDATRETPVGSMVRQVLAEAGAKPESIERVAIGLGPGSYTGIRLSLAWAHGWALARGAGVVGITSLEACLAQLPGPSTSEPPSWLLVDAQRGEFYVQGLKSHNGVWGLFGALELRTREAVQELVRQGGCLFGPGLATVLPPAIACFPTARQVGLLAEYRSAVADPGQLEPVYLRPVSFVKAPPVRQDLIDLAGPS